MMDDDPDGPIKRHTSVKIHLGQIACCSHDLLWDFLSVRAFLGWRSAALEFHLVLPRLGLL